MSGPWSRLDIGMLAAMMTGDLDKDTATLTDYLSAEPAQCRGNECESFDCEVCDSRKEPAQDDGKPEAFSSAIVKELRVNWAFDTEDALSVLNGATRRLEEAKECRGMYG